MAVGMDVELAGVAFHALTEEETVDRVRGALAQGAGGRILTPNVDILRQDPAPYAADASLVVADGMPLVWASRLAGRALPGAGFRGWGAALGFVGGDRRRAPQWMRRIGLEWLYRLGSEPRRLAGRYLRHDAPYAARLLANAAARRYGGVA